VAGDWAISSYMAGKAAAIRRVAAIGWRRGRNRLAHDLVRLSNASTTRARSEGGRAGAHGAVKPGELLFGESRNAVTVVIAAIPSARAW
jgi:hypothetical protein